MNAELQQLKDIHLPKGVSMLPIAPGWLILYAGFILLCFYAIYRFYKRHQKQKAIKFAIAKLKMLKKLASDNPEKINIAAEISTLIRRTALHYFSREKTASMVGENWLNFLNNSGKTLEFTQGCGRLLIDAPYRQKNSVEELIALIILTQTWLSTIAKNGHSMEK